jgi:hypothetical protein
VKYNEIKQMIITSSPHDWEVVTVDGATFLDQFGVRTTPERTWLDNESHTYLAVFRADVDLRLAWGLPHGENLSYQGWTFADPHISRHLVDGFWRGALVARWSLLSVDGGRCYLPEPSYSTVTDTGAPGDSKITGTTVTESELALARLLQGMTRAIGPDVDSYLRQSRAAVIPD